MSSKEKIGLHEREKHPSPALPSSPVEDEEEEGQTGQSQPQSQGKASSSSSSEEESESESDAESGKKRKRRSGVEPTELGRKVGVIWFVLWKVVNNGFHLGCRESQKPRAHQ